MMQIWNNGQWDIADHDNHLGGNAWQYMKNIINMQTGNEWIDNSHYHFPPQTQLRCAKEFLIATRTAVIFALKFRGLLANDLLPQKNL